MALVVRTKSQHQETIQDGIYPAQLTAVDIFENAYGPRAGFIFTLGGDAGGKTVMQSTATQLTPKSKLVSLIQNLTGLDLPEIGPALDLESLIGSCCYVLIKTSHNKSGITYSCIDQVWQTMPRC